MSTGSELRYRVDLSADDYAALMPTATGADCPVCYRGLAPCRDHPKPGLCICRGTEPQPDCPVHFADAKYPKKTP